MFIDTHCHLYAEEFDEDRHEVVERARQAGAEWLLLPNIDANSLGPLVSTCDEWPDLCRPMLGLHPTALPPDPQPLLDRMEQLLALPTSPFVAVGEVGVDLYWDSTRREEQMDVFRRQAEWSIRFNLPLIIHSRSAHAELLEVLTPFKHELPGGIFHCFGGSAREAEELLAFDRFFLGIGGVVTFKKSTLPAVLETTASDVYKRQPYSRRLCRSSASFSKPMRPISHRRPIAANATSRLSSRSSSTVLPMSTKPHRNA